MSLIVDVLSLGFAISGSLFVLIGVIGIFRMPNFTTKVHAAGMADVFGIAQILIAVILQYGWSVVSLKLALIIFLLVITSPVATHAMFKAYREVYPLK